MVKVLTVIEGVNPDMDEAVLMAKQMVEAGLITEFRPAYVMGESIEAIPVSDETRKVAKEQFINAGFEIVE